MATDNIDGDNGKQNCRRRACWSRLATINAIHDAMVRDGSNLLLHSPADAVEEATDHAAEDHGDIHFSVIALVWCLTQDLNLPSFIGQARNFYSLVNKLCEQRQCLIVIFFCLILRRKLQVINNNNGCVHL